MITSKQSLIKYIRQQLGEPIIRLELTDEHIGTIIDETVGLFVEVVYGDFNDTLLITAEQAMTPLYIPAFRSILNVQPANQSRWIPRNLFDVRFTSTSVYHPPQGRKDVQFSWNSFKRVLTINDNIIPELMIVLGITTYMQNDDNDHIFDERWVKAMAKAKSQKLWGQILGKYSQSLVGGSTINYDRIISEAETEIDALMEELNDKYVDIAPVMVI